MCGGGAADEQLQFAKNQAAEQERLRVEREGRITEGSQYIDSAFASYDDAYYNNYAKSITDYQLPQIQQQYGDTQGKLIAALAGRGILESTAGAGQMGRLEEAFLDRNAQSQNEALDATKSLRSSVENQKSDLYALNQAAADPTSMNAQAIGAATALRAPAATSPVSQAFTAFLDPMVAYKSAKNNAAPERPTSTAPVAVGAGSGRVVR